MQLQGIDIESYEFEYEEEREIQAPATPSDDDINSLLTAMMETIQVANQKLLADAYEASRAENQKTQEANKKLYTKVQETSRAENQKLFEASSFVKNSDIGETAGNT